MGHFDAPNFKLSNGASVASMCSDVRTCQRIRNSQKLATIHDFHVTGSNKLLFFVSTSLNGKCTAFTIHVQK